MKTCMAAGKSTFVRLRRALDPLRARFERFISGPAPDDPFYLSNRTWQQKLKVSVVVGAPVLLLIALVMAGATDMFRLHKVDPYERPAETPLAAKKPLPDPVLARRDLEVVNIHIARDVHPEVVTGIVRNNSNQKVDSAEVSYYLADTDGSLVATETADVTNVEPHGSVTFRTPLKVPDAEYVIVRDVRRN